MNHQSSNIKDQDFSFIQNFVYDHTGIVIADHKKDMISRRLSRRMRDLSIGDISDYCNVLKSGSEDEIKKFVNAVTTNLTSFFREKHHFDYLSDVFFPEFTRSKNNRLRIWSSASSTGEEPYSIVMTMLDYFGSSIKNYDAKVLATDLDTDVLHTCRAGRYSEKSLSNLPEGKAKKWFKNRGEVLGGYIEVEDELKEYIQFNQLNLTANWPMKGKFDVIFCRNVFIYFDKETQQKIIDRFCDYLEPNGCLMLGHSESILNGNNKFSNIGKTVYRKL